MRVRKAIKWFTYRHVRLASNVLCHGKAVDEVTRNTEVTQFDLPTTVDQHIRRLYICKKKGKYTKSILKRCCKHEVLRFLWFAHKPGEATLDVSLHELPTLRATEIDMVGKFEPCRALDVTIMQSSLGCKSPACYIAEKTIAHHHHPRTSINNVLLLSCGLAGQRIVAVICNAYLATHICKQMPSLRR